MKINETVKHYINIAIAIVIALLCINLLPASNGLTDVGVRVVSVFLAVIFLWLKEGTAWPSWLALMLIVLTGVMGPAAVFGGSYGNPLIVTVIGMMAFSQVLIDTGVIDTIVKWFVTREFVRNKPYRFIASILIVSALASVVSNVTALTVMFISLIAAVCEEIGYKKGDSFYSALMIGLFWVTNAVNAGSPLGGHTMPMILIASMKAAGYEVSIADWTLIGIPIAAVITLIAIIVICVIWKPESSKFVNYNIDKHRKEIKPFTTEGKINIVLLFGIILYWIIPSLFPDLLGAEVMALYNTWGANVPVVIAIALLCIIQVKGKPITTFKKATSVISITTITFIGCVMLMGTAISNSETGISAWLANLLSPLVSSMPTFAVVVLMNLLFIAMTNLMSNTVCMMLYFNISLPILASANISATGMAVIICIITGFASLIPSAAVTAPFYFDSEHITVKNTFKWNIIMALAVWALISFVVYPIIM